VGNGRPQPALFVEPRNAKAATDPTEETRLKREILERTKDFNEMRYVSSMRRQVEILMDLLRYLHERIEDERMIKLVPLGTLPRTAVKGNIRHVFLLVSSVLSLIVNPALAAVPLKNNSPPN